MTGQRAWNRLELNAEKLAKRKQPKKSIQELQLLTTLNDVTGRHDPCGVHTSKAYESLHPWEDNYFWQTLSMRHFACQMPHQLLHKFQSITKWHVASSLNSHSAKYNTCHQHGELEYPTCTMLTTLSSPIVGGQSTYLEPMLIYIMRFSMGYIIFDPMLNFKWKFSVGHKNCFSRIISVGDYLFFVLLLM